MTNNAAKDFWLTHLGVVSDGNAKIELFNPLDDFRARAHSGEFDALTDEQYFEKERNAKDFSAFWDYRRSETVGNIILNAIAKTNISTLDIKDIAGILADASTRTEYCAADPGEMQECDEDDLLNDDLDFSPADEPTPFDRGWTPRIIYNYLCNHIYGQESAKRVAAILVYNHINGNSRNIVMAGATGCGKTEIWRALSKKFDFIKIINAPMLSCNGFKGSYHIKDIFWDEPKKIRERLLVVIDEADKLFEPMIGSGGTDFARKIQDELLKIMDGDTITFCDDNNKGKRITVDCSGVSVVLCGSFERMLEQKTESSKSMGFGQQVQGRKESTVAECDEEDLIQYGNVRREIAGRISRIVTLDPLDENDFEAIMESPASPIRKIENSHHVSLYVDKDSRKKLACDAEKSKLGCRYIRSKLQNMLDNQMFDNPDKKEYSLYYE